MTQIKLRRDTAANFTSKNPVLGVGEPAYETDTKKLKIGDGTTAYTQLEYFTAGGGGSTDISATLPLKMVDGVISLEVDGQTIQVVDGKLTASSTAPTNMVTTDTAQDITGKKSFTTGKIKFKNTDNNRKILGEINNNGVYCNYFTDKTSGEKPCYLGKVARDVFNMGIPDLTGVTGRIFANTLTKWDGNNEVGTILDSSNLGSYVDGTTITYTNNKLSAASGSAPSNMVTTDTAQTISGDKTFEGPLTFKGNTNWRGTYNNNCRMNLVDTVDGSAYISISNANGNNAEYGVGGGSSYVTYFKPAYNSTKLLLNNYEDGSSENGITPIVEIAGNLQNRVNSTNYQVLTQNNVTAGDNITITNTTNGISIAATASSSAPANMVTTDTKQTITGNKEFKYGRHRFIINQVAGIVGIASGENSIWDLSTLQLNNQASASWAVGAKSKEGYIYATSLTRNDGNSNKAILDAGNLGSYVDGTTITYTNNKLSAASGSAPSNMVTTDTAQDITGNKTFSYIGIADIYGGRIRIGDGQSQIKMAYDGDTSASSATILADQSQNWRVGRSNKAGLIYSTSPLKRVGGGPDFTNYDILDSSNFISFCQNNADAIKAALGLS